jgi:hypothetical protein
MATMGAFCPPQAVESAFLAAIEPSDISLECSRLYAFIVEAHLKFHVPEPSVLEPIKLFINTLIRSSEFPLQALDFCDVWFNRRRVRGRHVQP